VESKHKAIGLLLVLILCSASVCVGGYLTADYFNQGIMAAMGAPSTLIKDDADYAREAHQALNITTLNEAEFFEAFMTSARSAKADPNSLTIFRWMEENTDNFDASAYITLQTILESCRNKDNQRAALLNHKTALTLKTFNAVLLTLAGLCSFPLLFSRALRGEIVKAEHHGSQRT